MSETATELTSEEDRGVQGKASAWSMLAFAAATFLGAFLLFQIQPLIGKFILPWFGGSPAVWTTCMLFFQIVLFAGYTYSHLVVSRLSPRSQAILQCLLLLAAITVLPIAPKDSWKPTDASAPTGRILLLLAATVGLPYFVLSTTSPLTQSWFSRRFPGRAPYRLYSLSNFGSFLALLSYPFVFEPAFDLTTQARLWSWVFPVYAVLIALCGATVWRLSRESSPATSALGSQVDEPRGSAASKMPLWTQRLLWLFLPACASLVLLATTNHVCENVPVVPFLLVVPLSLYLLTFIICFDHSRWYVRPLWAILAVLGIAAVMAGGKMLGSVGKSLHHKMTLTYVDELVLNFGTMFCICMICHGELVRLKPAPRHLTEFYLMLSAGGALGGAAVSLAAPHLFKTILEWNLGMLASYVIAIVVLFLAVPRAGPLRSAGFLLFGFAAGGLIPVLLLQWTTDPEIIDQERNFYGVVSVCDVNDPEKPDEHRRRLHHGAIPHGLQFVAVDKRRIPLTYYTEDSGVGEAIRELQKQRTPMRVGLVGLGVGTLASYARRGDRYTFYEINPAVADLAKKYFTYLKDAEDRGAIVNIEMGDARLTLERQPPQNFDLLVLDAFSGDSVPAHLLTKEAMEIYCRHVSEDSVIAIHSTNRFLYLFPVVRALAEDAHRDWRRVYRPVSDDGYRYRSDWVLITKQRTLLDDIPEIPPGEEEHLHDDFTIPVWTDQYNNLFRILQSGN